MWYLTHICWWFLLCEEFTDRTDPAETTVGIFFHNVGPLNKISSSFWNISEVDKHIKHSAPKSLTLPSEPVQRSGRKGWQGNCLLFSKCGDSELPRRELSRHPSLSPIIITEKCLNNKKIHKYKIHVYFINILHIFMFLLQLTYFKNTLSLYLLK